MEKNQDVGDGFKLLIGLSEIHVPRMWVEQHTDKPDHQVAIYFYMLDHIEMAWWLSCLPHLVGHGFVPRPSDTKEYHKNGTACLPAWQIGIRVGVWQCSLTV